jgi:outer membrane protein assembly factor BamA
VYCQTSNKLNKTIRATTAFVVFLLLCQSVHAQQQKGFILRSLDWGYRIVQGDSAKPHKKYIFLVPIVAYRPETRWTAGVSTNYFFRVSKANPDSTRLSFIRLNATYSQERQLHVQPKFEIFSPSNKWFIRGQYIYTDFSEYYWGIGSNMPNSNKEMYGFNMHRSSLRIMRKFSPNMYIGGNINLENMQNISFESRSSLRDGDVIGKNGYRAIGAGLNILFDNREHLYYPLTGWFIEVQQSSYGRALNSTSSFHQIILDARNYQRLWNDNVFALQFFGTWNIGDAPFRMMGTLGNENYFRGYYQGRYRDHHAMSFHAELRKTVWGPLGAVFFGGIGTVSRVASELHKDLKPAAGIGVRFKAIPRERINFRIDYAIGLDGSRTTYITMNEAF